MDRALLVITALLLNAAFGGPRRWYARSGIARIAHLPARWLRSLERKLNREQRSPKERAMRGWVMVIAAVVISLILGGILGWLFKANLRFVELVLLAVLLPVRPTWDLVSDIKTYLYAGDLANARNTLEGTVWRHHAVLDDNGVARAAVETMSVQFSEKILSPIFWYLFFGLPGLFATRIITLMQEIWPQLGTGAEDFGRATVWTHKLLHYIPSRCAGFVWLCVSLFLPSINGRRPLSRIIDALPEESPQMLSLICASSVLNLSLGGPGSIYSGGLWVEGGTAKAGNADLKQALYVFVLLNLLLCVLLWPFL